MVRKIDSTVTTLSIGDGNKFNKALFILYYIRGQ